MLKTQFRVIDRRTSASKALDAIDSVMGTLHKRAVSHMAQKVVEYSPVDTGTYMDSHNVRQGRDFGNPTESSAKKPRDQSYDDHASAALSRMAGQIESLGNAREAVISNDAVHARYVENGSSKMFGYAVYLRAREDTKDFIRSMVAEMRL